MTRYLLSSLMAKSIRLSSSIYYNYNTLPAVSTGPSHSRSDLTFQDAQYHTGHLNLVVCADFDLAWGAASSPQADTHSSLSLHFIIPFHV